MQSSDEFVFNRLGRILGGYDTTLDFKQDRWGRISRTMLAAHIAGKYDRFGCFCYVGWESSEKQPPPSRRSQIAILAAFARAAVAARVYLGALEPDEGFGMAVWQNPPAPAETAAAMDPISAMRSVIAHALALLSKSASGRAALLDTRIAMGCGRLRGGSLLGGQTPHVILNGPAIVERFYGELPNRCGAIAKGKDGEANQLFPATRPPLGQITVFWQAWTRFYHRVPDAAVPNKLIEKEHIEPRRPPGNILRLFLIGFSLDFAQSRLEYESDAHRARAAVEHILRTFDALTQKIPGLYISPRYGDGVAAVIVVDASTTAEALDESLPWFKEFKGFVQNANEQLSNCSKLGLRIGMAVQEDLKACAPRLAGVSQLSSPAVETLADSVVSSARKCHHIAKHHQNIVAEKNVKWLWLESGKQTVRLVLK